MINLEPHPTDPDKLIIKTQKYHFAKYTEEDLQAAIAAENEACAKVCDEFGEEWNRTIITDDISAAIRERMK